LKFYTSEGSGKARELRVADLTPTVGKKSYQLFIYKQIQYVMDKIGLVSGKYPDWSNHHTTCIKEKYKKREWKMEDGKR